MEMTIRKAIEQLNKVGGHTIHCRNGAKIYLTSMHDDEQSMSHFKTINDKRVCRKIYCYISEKEGVKTIPEIEKYSLKVEFDDGDIYDEYTYILPERIMNLLINYNGGIDTYNTISTLYYMMVDTFNLMEE